MNLERQYSEQEVAMLIRGLRMLVELDQGLKVLVDETGKKKIDAMCKRYRLLMQKLESEV